MDFYPSTTEDILRKALEYVRSLDVDVSSTEMDIIMNARKSLLFHNESTWVKRESGLFDVTMGSHDGAEVCELVGIYQVIHIAMQEHNSPIDNPE